ncbi:hypothetical protein ACFQZU_23790, partial [Streptomonospora algeriensis]
PVDGAPGPRPEHDPGPVRPEEPATVGIDAPREGDPDKTTTPMRRRRIGRPRWRGTSPEPRSDTLEFQRGEH